MHGTEAQADSAVLERSLPTMAASEQHNMAKTRRSPLLLLVEVFQADLLDVQPEKPHISYNPPFPSNTYKGFATGVGSLAMPSGPSG